MNTYVKEITLSYFKQGGDIKLIKEYIHTRSGPFLNGQWHYNSGGTQLEWRKMENAEEIKLIEDVFLETRAKQL